MRRLNRERLSTRRTFAVALILFAMLCGLTLVVARYPGMSADQNIRVRRALINIDKASHALEATNYGETRQFLRQARQALAKPSEQDRR